MKNKRWIAFLLVVVLVLFCFAGCSSTSSNEEGVNGTETLTGETTYPVTIKDDVGEVTLDKMPEKVVSLSPASTEIVYAIGAGERVVGDTEYCNYPEAATKVEKVGDFMSPNIEKILALEPDLIVSTNPVSPDITTKLKDAGTKVLVYNPVTIAQVENNVVRLGEALNLNDKATEVVDDMQSQLDSLLNELGEMEEEKSVFIDLGSYYSVGPGSLLNDMLDIIKAENIAANYDTAYPMLTTEQIIADDPDVYISLYTPVSELEKVAGFKEMDCFESNQVYSYAALSEVSDIISRPGPRVIDGMQKLAEDIYPEVFSK